MLQHTPVFWGATCVGQANLALACGGCVTFRLSSFAITFPLLSFASSTDVEVLIREPGELATAARGADVIGVVPTLLDPAQGGLHSCEPSASPSGGPPRRATKV